MSRPTPPIQTLHKWLDEEYRRMAFNPNVKSSVAYAAYKLWRRAEAAEKKGEFDVKGEFYV